MLVYVDSAALICSSVTPIAVLWRLSGRLFITRSGNTASRAHSPTREFVLSSYSIFILHAERYYYTIGGGVAEARLYSSGSSVASIVLQHRICDNWRQIERERERAKWRLGNPQLTKNVEPMIRPMEDTTTVCSLCVVVFSGTWEIPAKV